MTSIQKIIRASVVPLEFAKQFGNGSQACKMMATDRDSFYSRKKAVLENRVPDEPYACCWARPWAGWWA